MVAGIILKSNIMANKKRKAAKKTTTKRRRRMSGIGKMTPTNPIVKFGALAAGYFLADKINPMIDKVTGTLDGKIVAGAQVAGGLLANGMLPIMKGKRGMIAVAGGGILAGAGLKRALSEFGVVNGFHNVPAIAGFRSVPALQGFNPTPGSQLGSFNPTPSKVMGSVPATAEELYMAATDEGSGINPADR